VRAGDLRALELTMANAGGFGHREHLELAWRYLEKYPLERAKRVMAAAIRHLAGRHGAPEKYHETLTHAWVHLVAVHRARWSAPTFEQFIARNPRLLDRGLLEEHYTADLLWGAEARACWREPDRRSLPAPGRE
jgi:hypothetical protein